MSIVLTLPVLSANRYWRPVPIGKRVTIVPTKEAKQYKAQVQAIARAAGLKTPIIGRVKIEVWFYPHRPLDWERRVRKLGPNWDDGVQAIDLDNGNKVLLDALKGMAFEDDRWVFQLLAQRMTPDEKGERMVVRISPIPVIQPQGALL